MLPVRQSSIRLAITSSLIALSLVAFLHPQASAEESTPPCDEFGLAILSSPNAPWKGAALRVTVATEKPLAGELTLIGPSGNVVAQSR